MLKGLLGTKIGMSQIFDGNRNVIPVTVIDVGGWIVTQVKNGDVDGYVALQIGFPRKKYLNRPFSPEWLKKKDKFFAYVKEVQLKNESDVSSYVVGQRLSVKDLDVSLNDKVDIGGVSRGLGFQGVVKRWGFGGGPSGHGSTFHRAPGSIGNMCSQGNVIKGKKLPGHCGCRRVTVKNLEVVKIDEQTNSLLVRGAVPGKKDSLLFIYSKQV